MPAPRPQRPVPAARRQAPRPGGRGPAGPRLEGTDDSEREEYVPGKKSGAPPALTIGLLFLIVASAGVFIWAKFLRDDQAGPAGTSPVVKETTNKSEWQLIKEKIREAEGRYLDTIALRTDDTKVQAFQAKVEQTMEFISGVLEEIDVMLEPVRDPITGDLPDEYNGYNRDAKDLVVWMDDLNKSLNFGLGEKDD